MAMEDLGIADLHELGAFDTLGSRYNTSEVRVDTTVAITDALWMSLLWISDTDSAGGGICEYVLMMTYAPKEQRVKALKEIRTECDVDYGADELYYYEHRVLDPSKVKVVEEAPVKRDEMGEPIGDLIPVRWRTLTVRPLWLHR